MVAVRLLFERNDVIEPDLQRTGVGREADELRPVGGVDVFDAAPIHEGRVGFGFRSYQAGSEMTLDEFRIEPEIS